MKKQTKVICETLPSGIIVYYKNKTYDGSYKFHREDGPAVIYPNGTKWWCLNGKLHREDGSAIEYFDGINEWWHLKGNYYKKDQYYKKLFKFGKISKEELIIKLLSI